jgi:SAM-dependent methyltransferase
MQSPSRYTEPMSKARSTDNMEDLKQEMRQGWDGCAHGNWMHYVWREAGNSEERFRASGERDYKRYVGEFLAAVGAEPAKLAALEIGCGPGRMSEFFARDFRGLIAVDVSRELLKIGRKRVPASNVLWLCNDGTNLASVADDSVDFVFSLGVLECIRMGEVVGDYIQEAGRVLKPGGWLVFHVKNHPHLRLGAWMVALYISPRFHVPRLRVYKPGALDPQPIRIEVLRRSCAAAGLKAVRVAGRYTREMWVWVRKKS